MQLSSCADPSENCHLTVKKLPKTWHLKKKGNFLTVEWQFSRGSGTYSSDNVLCPMFQRVSVMTKLTCVMQQLASVCVAQEVLLGTTVPGLVTFNKLFNTYGFNIWSAEGPSQINIDFPMVWILSCIKFYEISL